MPSADEQDLIEVRQDERFNEARLQNYLRDRLAGADGELAVRQFGGGKANLTYLLTFDGALEYVLRRPPLGTYAPSAHDMGRENRVLSVLHNAFDYAPRIYHYCEDETVIGAPFLIMERCHGVVIRDTMPARFANDADAPQLLSKALVDTLAAFHAVDYEALGLSKLGRPKGFVKRQVEGWWWRWGAATQDDDERVSEIYRWLADHLPDSSYFSLVHNDYKLDNTMFDVQDPARVVAILDWDMCTLGDPLSDLGTLLTYWTGPKDSAPVRAIGTMPAGDFGFYSRGQILRRYAERSRRDLSDIPFYHVLGIFRLLVILQQIYSRYRRGFTQDERFARLNESVDALSEWALQVMEGSND
ncbi:MAG: phosphotransferase family protein [Chloroflexota bacterium]|nr:phosphotransferase family protein [Chloroflexota bacterium]MDE2911086.1 phosphotransferase family protein [Chloroflexota bacterium]